MAGTVTVMPGVDLTAPSGEDWQVEAGQNRDSDTTQQPSTPKQP
jgi:hypothetical protein